jgi:Flp pilus assembly pilin Flp
MLIKCRKAQSTLEYALIVAVVVGALLAMQVYVKRGLQGRLKSATDDIGDQYSPGYTESVITVDIESESTETLEDGVTSIESDTTQERDETTEIADYTDEYWGAE